ncbi:MAG: AMIN domain-containing protein, partial [Armatimonadota bacterium]|nr:AMIN domain-containing protein [Armatimonadota bacterium]
MQLLVFLVLASLALGVPSSGGAATGRGIARLVSVTVKEFIGKLQVGIVADGRVSYRLIELENPPRVAIDVFPVVLEAGVLPLLHVGKGPVVRVRVSQFQEETVRVVLDLTKQVKVQVEQVAPQVVVAAVSLPMAVASSSKPIEAPPATKRVLPSPPAVAAQVKPSSEQSEQPPPLYSPSPTAQERPSRITLELRDAELADVLSALGRICNFNIVTDASVKGRVTIRLLDVTCDEALRLVLEPNNLAYKRVGRNLIVMAAEKLAPPPEIPQTIIYPLNFGDAEQARAAVAATVPGIRVAIDKRTNALIVTGTQSQHEEVQKVLVALDIQIPQVMIEARVVDISASTLEQLGLQWGFTLGPHGTVKGEESTSRVTIGIVSGPILQASLNALVTEGKARVLSAPRVAVVDGNKASIVLGDEIPIPQRDAQGNITFTFRPVGVNLSITPRVNRDGLITTVIVPEVSRVIEFLSTPAGPVPRIGTRKVDSIVTVKDGDSIVIAGLISDEERKTMVKVPLLGDIPVIGSLFRFTTTDVR